MYRRSKRASHPATVFIQLVKKPRESVCHSYDDWSKVPNESGEEMPANIEDMSFAQKIHHMLAQEEYSHCVTWLPHGRSFTIFKPVQFEKDVCGRYFGHRRYSSFLRQLSNHGFKLITKGPERNSYYHECMLRGLPHLCQYMPEAKEARRLFPDPDNEPNFTLISEAHPLPDMQQPQQQQQQPAEASPPTETTAPQQGNALLRLLDRNSSLHSVTSSPQPLVPSNEMSRVATYQALLSQGLAPPAAAPAPAVAPVPAVAALPQQLPAYSSTVPASNDAALTLLAQFLAQQLTR